jgi:hypothetical protein
MLIEPHIRRVRQKVLREKSVKVGILGNDAGTTVYTNRKSEFWVRFPAGTDSNGNTLYSTALPIRYAPSAPVIEKVGVKVLIKIDYDGHESIKEMAADWFTDNDIDSRVVNPASSYRVSGWVLLRNIVRMVTRAVGSVANVASTLLTVRENPHFTDDTLDWWNYTGTVNEADKVDLASYIPAVDTHCLVIVWFDTFQQEPYVTASTAQALTSGLDSTDYDECYAQLLHNEYIPLVAYRLADDQTGITDNDLINDLRQFMNAPRVYGFPNPIVSGQAILIRDTHQELTYDLTVQGEFTVQGEWTNL